MTFDDLYPDADAGVPVTQLIVPCLHEDQARPCSVCNQETRWFHRDLIVHVCSEECLAKFWERN